jgi:hypothetical protein
MMPPDFLVVGAPKCGTTALCDFLGQHPDVFVAPRKEMHYFGADLVWPNRPDLDEYLAQFHGRGSARVAGEASVYYLYSQSAAREIHALNPRMRILVLLRNPVDVICSLHWQVLFNMQEDIADFELALAAEPARRRGENLPALCTKPQQLYYRAAIDFADQLGRYLDVFGAQQVHVILHDDLLREPLAVYAGVLCFLGVDATFVPELRSVNPGRAFRSRVLQQLITHPPRWLVAGSRGLRSSPALLSAWNRLSALNSRPQSAPPLRPETRARLCAEFAPGVERLSRLLGRDLNHWVMA